MAGDANGATTSSSSSSMAEGLYSSAKTSVWWDIENCAVPKGSDVHAIAQNISSALVKLNYCGAVSISAYGDTNRLTSSVQQALNSTGISLNHVPAGAKDASDKKILVDMLFWAVDNSAPANYLLISGDRDFSNALHQLRMRRYNILLAQPQQASVPLVAAAKSVWLWTSLCVGGSPLTTGESSRLANILPGDAQSKGNFIQKNKNQPSIPRSSSAPLVGPDSKNNDYSREPEHTQVKQFKKAPHEFFGLHKSQSVDSVSGYTPNLLPGDPQSSGSNDNNFVGHPQNHYPPPARPNIQMHPTAAPHDFPSHPHPMRPNFQTQPTAVPHDFPLHPHPMRPNFQAHPTVVPHDFPSYPHNYMHPMPHNFIRPMPLNAEGPRCSPVDLMNPDFCRQSMSEYPNYTQHPSFSQAGGDLKPAAIHHPVSNFPIHHPGNNLPGNGIWGPQGGLPPSEAVQTLIGIILLTLNTLQTEKLVPTEANITDCIRYGDPRYRNTDARKALDIAVDQQVIVKQNLGVLQLYVGRKDKLWNCVNPIGGNPNQYPKATWDGVKNFLASSAGRSALLASKCRYEAALVLKGACLREVSLGEVLQILNMICTTKKWIVPHQSGWQPIKVILAIKN